MMGMWLKTIISKFLQLFSKRRIIRKRNRLFFRLKNLKTEPKEHQLFVDVSVIYRDDAKTGIQRVVRALLGRLLLSPPKNYVVRPIMATRKRPYRYVNWDGSPDFTKIEISQGDIFLGLDLSAHIIPNHLRQLEGWKQRGVVFHFLIYVILPLRYPEWFSPKLVTAFKKWVKSIAILADNVICISKTTEKDLSVWLAENYGFKLNEVASSVIPMGWDVENTMPTSGFPNDYSSFLFELQKRKTILIVGTIEPRKGHAQIINSFEKLWSSGNNYNLVIVGKPGWKTEELQMQIRKHIKKNTNLFWFENLSDEALLHLYKMCDGVIVPSFAEGFGLPLIEALGHNKRVLARELPIFREIAGSEIDYFINSPSDDVSESILNWIHSFEYTTNNHFSNKLFTWDDAYNKLTEILFNTKK